jgi:hypothetical protein
MQQITERISAMKHHGAVARRCFGVFLAIAGGLILIDDVAADQQPGETETQSSFYTYHDDWAIVSAPPPPGPYQSVNIDPRIPGQEDVRAPFVSGYNESSPPGEQLPDDFTDDVPPAAGTPSQAATTAYPGQESFRNEPPPGYYRSRGYNQNRPAPVQDSRGPYGYPQSGNYRYGYTPSPWSNPPQQRREDEVPPPPPVYNRMAAPPHPVYRSGPAPDQFYRRGTGTQ